MELTGKDGDKFSEYSNRARIAGKVGIFRLFEYSEFSDYSENS